MGKFKPSVEIPKNVKLTEEYVEQNRNHIVDMMEWFLNYPDVLNNSTFCGWAKEKFLNCWEILKLLCLKSPRSESRNKSRDS